MLYSKTLNEKTSEREKRAKAVILFNPIFFYLLFYLNPSDLHEMEWVENVQGARN